MFEYGKDIPLDDVTYSPEPKHEEVAEDADESASDQPMFVYGMDIPFDK